MKIKCINENIANYTRLGRIIPKSFVEIDRLNFKQDKNFVIESLKADKNIEFEVVEVKAKKDKE